MFNIVWEVNLGRFFVIFSLLGRVRDGEEIEMFLYFRYLRLEEFYFMCFIFIFVIIKILLIGGFIGFVF